MEAAYACYPRLYALRTEESNSGEIFGKHRAVRSL
jgi:hypothetical protein